MGPRRRQVRIVTPEQAERMALRARRNLKTGKTVGKITLEVMQSLDFLYRLKRSPNGLNPRQERTYWMLQGLQHEIFSTLAPGYDKPKRGKR